MSTQPVSPRTAASHPHAADPDSIARQAVPSDRRADLPDDPALPQMALAFDLPTMAQRFDAELRGLRVVDCTIDRAKYHPRRNCSVSYRLRLSADAQDVRFEQYVCVLFCHGGDAGRRYASALRKGGIPSVAGPIVSHWAELDAVVWWLPNDARLSAMGLLQDAGELRRRSLVDVVPLLSDGPVALLDHRTTLVQYVPARRICARVDLDIRRASGTTMSTRTLYVKADVDGIGATTHAVMAALTRGAAQRHGHLFTPATVLWQPSTGLHWQHACAGRPLQAGTAGVAPENARRVGRHLAGLHATPVSMPKSYDAMDLRLRLQEAGRFLTTVVPASALQVESLVQRLTRDVGLPTASPAVTLHGDLHPGNILDDGQRLTFIDLDSVRRGPAIIELGAWVGDTLYRALLGETAPVATVASWRAFLEGYRQRSEHDVDERQLAWSVSFHLLCRRACGCVAGLKPGRFRIVPELLAMADIVASTASVDALARAWGPGR